MERTVHTYCRICLANCGLEVTVDDDAKRVTSIKPDRANPYTWRDFCKKGKTANEIVEHPRRITRPMRRVGEGQYVEATYEEAIADIAARLNTIIDTHGPDAVGSYNGNPMGFSFATTTFWTGLLDAIGTGNRFWVGSIDQNNCHVVTEHVYGNELVALIPDIDDCDFFLLVGMDPAVSRFNWLENNPDGWNRVLARQRDGAEVVVVDPRRSRSALKAGTHLAPLPGTDWAFLLALVKVILDEGLERPSTAVPLSGLDDVRRLAAAADLDDLASRCGIELDAIADLARRFARARTAMCVSHTGVAHNAMGTIGEWLCHVLNLLTDRVDQPGGRRFERGVVDIGMVMKMFAPASTHRTRVRGLPTIAGFHSLAELPDEITTPGEGQIRAMLIGFGNPVVSGPDGDRLDAALGELDLLVAFDLVQRESHRHAHWLIPGTHWLEREEFNPLLANLQERPYLNFAARTIDPPEGVREEAEVFADLALAMDRNLFGRPGVNRIVRASRALARVTRRPKLAMSPEWVQRLLILMGRRVKWRDVVSNPHGLLWSEPRYGDLKDTISTPDKTVQLAPEAFVQATLSALGERPATDPDHPLILMNKRGREAMNSWLNESPGLKAVEKNDIDIHPDDAARIGVSDGDLVRLVSPLGAIELPANVTDGMRPGVVCVMHGWGGRVFDPVGGAEPESIGVNRNLLTSGADLDAFSQTPHFNSTAVRLERVEGPDGAAPDAVPAAARV